MAQVNFAKKEISCKIVYYGPGMAGKTTNLQAIQTKIPGQKKGDLTSIATEGDRTLFFDYMPLDLGSVGGLRTRLQLYTVPGQVFYNATRKLVLEGADGVIFVADSRVSQLQENLDSFANLQENLREHGVDPAKLPLVLQWNKRDMPQILSTEELNAKLNAFGSPACESVAVTGHGVLATLKAAAQLVIEDLDRWRGEG